MTVRQSQSEFLLAALNEETGWFDLRGATADFGFTLYSASFVGTVELQVSNQLSEPPKTRYTTVTSYSASAGPLNIPREVGSFVRFIVTAYTSGSMYVGISPTIDANGQVIYPNPQGNTNHPVGTF